MCSSECIVLCSSLVRGSASHRLVYDCCSKCCTGVFYINADTVCQLGLQSGVFDGQ